MERGESPLRLGKIEALTFDCYGTLVDWETGILSSLGRVARAHRPDLDDEAILEAYAAAEAAAEEGPYKPYRVVLRSVFRSVAERLGFPATPALASCLERSLPEWPPFPDTVPALRALSRSYPLGVVANIDSDLFALTARTLEVDFDWVITAEDVGSYKPCARNFEEAIARIGLPRAEIAHVAQSLYHDVGPAGAAGLRTVWVDRRAGRRGFGATPASTAEADLTVRDLTELARALGAVPEEER